MSSENLTMKHFVNSILENKYLVIILLIGAVVRFVSIATTPPSLNWDEISHGYNAFSILKSGKDEWGELFPFIFRAYGDYKLPVYIYSIVPSIAIFGLTEFAVRFPSITAGIGSVIFTYLLVSEMVNGSWLKVEKIKSKDNALITSPQSLPLITALLMAIEPWSLFLSRGAFEANLAQFFIIAGSYYFVKAIYQIKQSESMSKPLVFSIILFGLSVWTYNSARVFVPLLLVGLSVTFRNEFIIIAQTNKKLTAYCLLLLALFFLPMFYQLAHPVGSARYDKVQILDQGAINQIIEGRNSSNLNPVFSRALHNKATYFTKKFVLNYLSHFDPRFLFIEGGSQYQFSVPENGLLYLVNLPLFYLGLVLVLRNGLLSKYDNSRRRNNWRLVLIWLLLAPIPSSLTREAPHVLRSITFLPIPMVLTSVGLVTVLEKSRIYNLKSKISLKYLLLTAYCLLLGFSLYKYLNVYFNNYRTSYSWAWQYGYKEVVQYTKEHYSEYDKIVMTKKYGEPHEFVLFYNKWNPDSYRNDPNLNRFAQSDWYWIDGFDKYYFVNDWQVDEVGTGNYTFNLESKEVVQCTPKMFDCLLITSPGTVPDGWKLLDTIYFLNGEKAFEIYEN